MTFEQFGRKLRKFIDGQLLPYGFILFGLPLLATVLGFALQGIFGYQATFSAVILLSGLFCRPASPNLKRWKSFLFGIAYITFAVLSFNNISNAEKIYYTANKDIKAHVIRDQVLFEVEDYEDLLSCYYSELPEGTTWDDSCGMELYYRARTDVFGDTLPRANFLLINGKFVELDFMEFEN